MPLRERTCSWMRTAVTKLGVSRIAETTSFMSETRHSASNEPIPGPLVAAGVSDHVWIEELVTLLG
jgi:hypothetical protein